MALHLQGQPSISHVLLTYPMDDIVYELSSRASAPDIVVDANMPQYVLWAAIRSQQYFAQTNNIWGVTDDSQPSC